MKSLIKPSVMIIDLSPSSSMTSLLSTLQSHQWRKRKGHIKAKIWRSSKSLQNTVSKCLFGRWTKLCSEVSLRSASSTCLLHTPSNVGSSPHLSNRGNGMIPIQVLVTPAVLPAARSLLLRQFYQFFLLGYYSNPCHT